jgi:hypothetical protein
VRRARLACCLALVGTLLALAGCAYPCVDACEGATEELATRGYDPAVACQQGGIPSAMDCTSCKLAIRDALRFKPDELMCECPGESDVLSIEQDDGSFESVEPDEQVCAELGFR